MSLSEDTPAMARRTVPGRAGRARPGSFPGLAVIRGLEFHNLARGLDVVHLAVLIVDNHQGRGIQGRRRAYPVPVTPGLAVPADDVDVAGRGHGGHDDDTVGPARRRDTGRDAA